MIAPTGGIKCTKVYYIYTKQYNLFLLVSVCSFISSANSLKLLFSKVDMYVCISNWISVLSKQKTLNFFFTNYTKKTRVFLQITDYVISIFLSNELAHY